MDDAKKPLGSEHWRPDFKKLAFDYLKYAQSTDGGAHVSLIEGQFDRAFAWYDDVVLEYKRATEGDNYADTKIDHHKIIAFYVLAILWARPFSYNPPSIAKNQTDRSWFAMLPNEYYCICLIELVFLGWHNDKTRKIRLDDNYRRCLIILFHRILLLGEVRDVIPLAHIVYFIEKCFFH